MLLLFCVIGRQLDELDEGAQEERRSKLRTTRLHLAIQRVLRRDGGNDVDSTTLFSRVAPCNRTSRKQAAAQFCALLALKKLQVVDVQQKLPFDDIVIRRGPKFDTDLS
jgi:chromatin segregation and condensation protein Rec8/ScpA/Scc1 (kleisin family)